MKNILNLMKFKNISKSVAVRCKGLDNRDLTSVMRDLRFECPILNKIFIFSQQ